MPAARTVDIATTHASSRARARERGFTLIELIVVMIILGILGSIAMIAMSGARATAREKEALTAAVAYDQAISQWQTDNANHLPGAEHMLPGPNGPKNLVGRPYMQVPAGVSGGRIGVSLLNNLNCQPNLAAPAGAAGETGWVSFCAGTEPSYEIRLITRKSGSSSWTSDGAKLCWRGNTARLPRCD